MKWRNTRKVLIAVPTIDYIESATFKSIYDLEIPKHVDIDFQTFRGYGIEHIRNVIVEYVLEKEYDYLFFVDSDLILPIDGLLKLYKHNKEVISGIYAQKKPGQKIVEAFITRNDKMVHIPLEELQPPGLHKVIVGSMGCTLIHRTILEKIPFPQFEYFFSLDPRNVISEDISFFQKVSEIGIQSFVDSSVVCGHIGKFVFNP